MANLATRRVDPVSFHSELQTRLAAGVDDTRAAAASVGAGRSLTLRDVTDAVAFTYRAGESGVEIAEGPGGNVVAELDRDAFEDLLTERWSVFGLLYSQRIRITSGTFEQFASWEPALQNLWFGRDLYDDAAVDRLGSGDDGFDPARDFTLADDDAVLAAQLQRAGFLVLRQVFTEAEIAELDAEERRLQALATPEDGRSWWATDASGHEVCCRLTYTSMRSDIFGRLHEDPRLRRIAALHGEALSPAPDRLDGTSVVIKNPAVVSGLSDLPWHRDCGMGGHPVLCPGINIGIQLDEASAANGQLAFLAGSHHHTNLPGEIARHPDWPVVAVDARPGDVTVHYAHVLHVAPPPTSPTAHRRAVYVSFVNPEVFSVVPEGKGYNDVVFHHGDGRVRNVDELSAS